MAAEAGVSKGGPRYHFRSKHELLEAMVTGWLDHFEREIEIAAAQEGGSFARGYVKACDPSGWAEAERASEFGLLAALIAEPDVLAKARKRYEAWQARLSGRTSTSPSPGSPPRGCGSSTCSGLGPPTGDLRGASPRGCSS